MAALTPSNGDGSALPDRNRWRGTIPKMPIAVRLCAALCGATLLLLPAGSALAQGIAQIRQVDRDFTADAFLGGAKVAHEMIAKAFAEGDRRTLKPLLSDDVYRGFDDAISARERQGAKVEFSFVGLKAATLEDAGLRGRLAEVTVKFVSELISATRDAAGAVIEGAAGAVREVTDVWTFARDTRSSDPNWKLVATASA
jgi:predicted lipid-binding transport protein (Tim44 family)